MILLIIITIIIPTENNTVRFDEYHCYCVFCGCDTLLMNISSCVLGGVEALLGREKDPLTMGVFSKRDFDLLTNVDMYINNWESSGYTNIKFMVTRNYLLISTT